MKLSEWVLVSLIASSICLPSRAGEEEKKEKKTEAVKRFNEGVSFFNAAEYQKAVEAFRKANRIFPAWKIQYNIGQCEAALKRYGLAIEAFEHYLGEGGDDIEVERRDEVLSELDRLRRMVGTVRVRGEDGVGVFIDGIERGRTPIQSPILVTAGVEHWFWLVSADGSKLLSVKDTVSGGQSIELTTPGYNLPKTAPAVVPKDAGPEIPGGGPSPPPSTTAKVETGAIPSSPTDAATAKTTEPQPMDAHGAAPESVGDTPPEAAGSESPQTTKSEPPQTATKGPLPAETATESPNTTGEPAREQNRMEPATPGNSPFEEPSSEIATYDEKFGISPALFWVGASGTLAFGAVAITMGILVDQKWEKAKKNPTNEAVRNNGTSLQTVGYIALGLTGAALITAVVAAPLTEWKKTSETPTPISLAISPWVAANSGGIFVDGRFSL